MNQKKIVFILLISFNIFNSYAINNRKPIQLLDSVTTLYNEKEYKIRQKVSKDLIKIVDESKIGIKELRVDNLKQIAKSYSFINDAKNASSYIDAYIKLTHDVEVLNRKEFVKFNDNSDFSKLRNTYLPKINFWIIFIITSGVIGLFVSLIINFRKNGDTLSNILIGLFVLLHSMFLLHLSLYLTNLNYNYPHSLWATITFSFLYGPLLYFYFKRISEKYVFKLKDLVHLIPTFFIIIYFIPIYILPSEVKYDKMFNIDNEYTNILYIVVFCKSLSLIFYGFKTYNIYRRNNKKKNRNDEVLNWQKNMSLLNIIYAVTYTIYGLFLLFAVIDSRSNNFMLYPQVIVLAVIVLYVSYTVYVKPSIFYEKTLFPEILHKYQKSGLTFTLSAELKDQLLLLLNKEKIFKDNNISLNSLSESLGTTRHSLSQVINEHFEMNFFNLINKFRVEEAKRILLNDEYKNLNIIDVAYEVGFNNKVTFNKAFKENTNLTPSQFLKHYQHSKTLH